VVLAGVSGFGVSYFLNTSPKSGNGQDSLLFRVEKGESVRSIADRLEQINLIKSSSFLVVISRVRDTHGSFRFGSYRLRTDLTTLQIHDLLVSGSQELKRITIPEGWTIRRIGEHLENEGITSAGIFHEASRDPLILERYDIPAGNVEGYLYPDTYMFEEDYPASMIVSHMIENFYRALYEIDVNARTLEPEKLHGKVILASIIEREYMTAEEAPRIASVFYNRLEANARLESCATVVYVMVEEQGLSHPSQLLYSDLERPSRYNTYLHTGLPLGPISNPGRVALHAVMHPENTDYWFFVLKGPGADRHHFSETFQEHNQASVIYLRSE
jgi:UPF0755 protein